MDKTLLITKLKTTNIGNQALSDEVIKLYEKHPERLTVSGRPEGLFGYSIEKLVGSDNPVAKFERWADNLVANLKHTVATNEFKANTSRVELLSFDNFKVKNDKWFQRVKNIFRRYVHAESIFAKAYAKRFAKISSVNAIIYSGAGEVGDNNIFLRQLLELRVAQKLNIKTYAINQSVEVVESPMKEICGFVYQKMNLIVVRGDVSKNNMIAIGVPGEKIKCYPDSAFLNPNPSPAMVKEMKQHYKIVTPAVGINATKVASDMNAWKAITGLLKSLGYNLYFISNDPFGDKEIGEKLAAQFGLIPIIEFIDYPKYAALMTNFEFVISCRLHTNELSLTAGTPIIPIEGSHFKTREVFSLVKYPIPVTNALTPEWKEEIMKHIKTLHQKDQSVKDFIANLDAVRKLSEHNHLMN
jgi:polysaccharide pyruvyl transferase WcaK-like protein